MSMVGAAAKPTGPPQQPMQKARPNSTQREGGAKRNGRPSAWVRVFISVVLLWHLSAVALAPLSLPPSSQLVVDIAQQPPMQWYLDLLYLNHGYHFFAPDPGEGHLIRYEVFDSRGSVIKQGEFPNADLNRPRLLYHRYFMLADQVGIPAEDEQYRQFWQRKQLEAYARHLLRLHDGESIRLRWTVHYQLPPDLARQGRKITDPESYRVEMEVIQRRSDLGENAAPQNTQSEVWQQGVPSTAGRWMGAPR